MRFIKNLSCCERCKNFEAIDVFAEKSMHNCKNARKEYTQNNNANCEEVICTREIR